MSTRTKVLALSAFLSIFILAIGYNLGGRLGLLFGLLIALGFLIFFLLQGENLSTSFYKAEKISGQDPWQLLPLIKAIAHAEKTKLPDAYVFSHPGIHCFSYWSLLSAPKICFSDSALNQLSSEEIRLLTIHQLLLLKKTDAPKYLFIQRFSQSIVACARGFDHLVSLKFVLNKDIVFLEKIIGFFAEKAIDIVYNERLYYELDLLTAQRTQNRDALGNLLWRINGMNHTLPLPLLACSRHLFFLNPRLSSSKFRKRIQKLVGYYPV